MRLFTTLFIFLLCAFSVLSQDPVFTQKILTESFSDNTQNRFGKALAIDGNTAIVSAAKFDSIFGVVYVLEYNGNSWSNVAKLTSSTPCTFEFGKSISISNNVIVIGDAYFNQNGAVFIYSKPSTGWQDMTETSMLLPDSTISYTGFGTNVELENDILVVGSRFTSSSGYPVCVYSKPVGGWTQMNPTAILSPNAVDYVGFASDIDMENDVIVIGASYESRGASRNGGVYVYEKGNGGWTSGTETARLSSSGNENNIYLGLSVSIEDDLIAASSRRPNPDGTNGAVHVFQRSLLGWIGLASEGVYSATSDTINSYSTYIKDVAVIDGEILVGIEGNSVHRGTIAVYTSTNNSWPGGNESRVLRNYPILSYFVSMSLVANSDHLLIGIDNATANGQLSGHLMTIKNTNGAYSGSEPYQEVKPGFVEKFLGNGDLVYNQNEFESAFANSMDIEGDIAVVGNPLYNFNRGKVVVYQFSNHQWITKAILSPGYPASGFGNKVLIKDDVIIVVPKNSSGVRGYIYEKPSGGWVDMEPTALLYGGTCSHCRVGMDGNTVVFGAPKDNTNGYYTGRAFVYEKTTPEWINMNVTAILTDTDSSNQAFFGDAVLVQGDDIFVGLKRNIYYGKVNIYSRPQGGWQTTNQHAEINVQDYYFGQSLAIDGDVLAIGSSYGGYNGPLRIYKKNGIDWSNPQVVRILYPDSDYSLFPLYMSSYGQSLEIEGDKLYVGATQRVNSNSNERTGGVYVYTKYTQSWASPLDTFVIEPSDGISADYFAWNIAASGDKIIVGAPARDEQVENSGAVYAYEFCITKGTDVIFSCNEYTWIDGVTYTESNSEAQFIFQNAAGCDSIVTLDLTIFDDPTITFYGDTLFCPSNDPLGYYSWINCTTGELIHGEVDQLFMPDTTGYYACIYTVGNCSDTTNCLYKFIEKEDEPIGLGLNESATLSFKVVPNPIYNAFEIWDLPTGSSEIEVYDTRGTLIYSDQHEGSSIMKINSSNWPRAVYLVKVRSGGAESVLRVVK